MAAIRDAFLPTPYSGFMLVSVYVLLCLLYIVFGKKLATGLPKMILKSLPILFLIAFFIKTVTSLPIGPVQGVGDVEHLERLIFGLGFSCLGDCYLVFDSFFVHGLLSFACAQVVYIGLFNGGLLLFNIPTQSELLVAVAIGLVSVLVYLYILPKLSCVLVVPAAIYCMLLSCMLWCSIVSMQQNATLSTLQGAIGSCLFYSSDLVLSLDRWGMKSFYGPYVIIVTYYSAQILIFFSVINSF